MCISISRILSAFSRGVWTSSRYWRGLRVVWSHIGYSAVRVLQAHWSQGAYWRHWRMWTWPARPGREQSVAVPLCMTPAASEGTSWYCMERWGPVEWVSIRRELMGIVNGNWGPTQTKHQRLHAFRTFCLMLHHYYRIVPNFQGVQLLRTV